MPTIPILMPQLGESIAEATVVRILIEPGQRVDPGADIFEVETNKATMAVAAPCGGLVDQVIAKANESYAVGAALGSLHVSDEDAQALGFQNDPKAPIDAAQPANTDSVHFQF
ncbi:MAG: lipoyl domain-containing protein, partial [Verrucomicrobiales bacterium]|nr:lipoyl domain-containing protein [Verrucomicrobiales bacterium]